jgi:cold-inducible RNA-binding protein
MGTRLYVGNRSFNTSPESVRAAYAAVGNVRDVSMPTDRETGQPRGLAFVIMATPQEADNAIAHLNGMMLDGRPLGVNEALDRHAIPDVHWPGGGFVGGGGRGGGGSGGRGGGRDRY